jgi:hypothetical protein
MTDSFAPFLKRPSFYQDENAYNKSYIDFIPQLDSKDIKDKNVVDNILNFLDGLNLESSSELLGVKDLEEELSNYKELDKNVMKAKPGDGGEGGAAPDLGAAPEEPEAGGEEPPK